MNCILPDVDAICLYADRPHYILESIQCFQAQTYPNKHLLIFDNGSEPVRDLVPHTPDISIIRDGSATRRTIGELRNQANSLAHADILTHWDCDDRSHCARMAEQVETLRQNPNADITGYYTMPFYVESSKETWIYTGTMLGTSFCYWNSVWQDHRFEHTSRGEDTTFLFGLVQVPSPSNCDDSRMVARIHSGNTSTSYDPDKMTASQNWRKMT